jgi:hypothetical protein
MPPFFSTECPHCKQQNRFDLAELKRTNTVAYKSFDTRSLTGSAEEFSVACSHCGRKFKLLVRGGKDGKQK